MCYTVLVPRPTASPRNGFTLIELLVVIAIILILAAILFPVFARARENARRTSCLSNFKQIGMGIMQYTQDHDEKFPNNWDKTALQTDTSMPGYKFIVIDGSGSPSGRYPTWMDFIYPYAKSLQIFDCPSVPVANRDRPSYGYSGCFGGRNKSSYDNRLSDTAPISLATVTRPAEVYVVFEFNSYYSYYAGPYDVGDKARHALAANNFLVAPHLSGGSAAFADGHVKWMPRAKMQAWPSVNTSCNPGSPDATRAYCEPAWNPFIS